MHSLSGDRKRECFLRPCEVLAVGFRSYSRDLVASLVAQAAAYHGIVWVNFEDRLPEEGLDTVGAILIDAMAPSKSLARLAHDDRLAFRVRVLVNLSDCSAKRLWAIHEDHGLKPLLLNDDDGGASIEEMAQLLFAEPITRRVADVLDEICSPEQKRLVLQFMQRSGSRGPGQVAKARAESHRSLQRACARLGLSRPRDLDRLARVFRGINWMWRTGATLATGALVAGYSRPSAFSRAVEGAFGVTHGELLADWGTLPALRDHLRAALSRDDAT